MSVSRYTTVAFPAYSYVPGHFPHPHSGAAGHRFGRDFDNCDWFLLGVDLFNHGYYWEAHEAWETRWHALGRRGATADFVKALIQLAVVGVKLRQQMPASAAAHARRAAELLHQVQHELANPQCMGLALNELAIHAEHLAAGPLPVVAQPLAPVEVLFAFTLSPDAMP